MEFNQMMVGKRVREIETGDCGTVSAEREEWFNDNAIYVDWDDGSRLWLHIKDVEFISSTDSVSGATISDKSADKVDAERYRAWRDAAVTNSTPLFKPPWWLIEHVSDDPQIVKTLPNMPEDPLAVPEVSITPLYTRPAGTRTQQALENNKACVRGEFERWARNFGYQRDELARHSSGVVSGEYFDMNTETAYQAYMAGRVDVLQDLVEKQESGSDTCTDPDNCNRCLTMHEHRGNMEHAGISSTTVPEQADI